MNCRLLARNIKQDELGSPVRLTELRSGRQTLYGYDEFGADLFGNQGETQPFGYTGYQPDRTAGTSYAQAREYLPFSRAVRQKGSDQRICGAAFYIE